MDVLSTSCAHRIFGKVRGASLRGGNLRGVVSEDLKSDVHYRAADNGACLPSCDCTMKSERLTLL